MTSSTMQPCGSCVECDVDQLARNSYFTGKLLVERDFTDEQRYFLGKARRHNQALHGTGVACGLKVIEHPNPGCRAQYVLVEPGIAVDCCGREIVVQRQELFDVRAAFLAAWQQANGVNAAPDTAEHSVLVCIAYAECGTEEIPVLFDNCQAEACHPNRIADGWRLSVEIDPPPPTDPPSAAVEWDRTLNVADAVRAVEANGVVYVLAAGNPGTLYAFKADNQALLAAQPLPATPYDLALSPSGANAYVSLDGSDAVAVLDLSSLGQSTAIVNRLPIAQPSGPLLLAVHPAGDRLVAAGAQVTVWNNSINATLADPATAQIGSTETLPGAGAAVVAGATSAYVAMPSQGGGAGQASVAVVDLASGSLGTAISLPGIVPSSLALAESTAGEKLYVGDAVAKAVSAVPLSATPPAVAGTATLTEAPVALSVSAGGRWLFALVQDATNARRGPGGRRVRARDRAGDRRRRRAGTDRHSARGAVAVERRPRAVRHLLRAARRRRRRRRGGRAHGHRCRLRRPDRSDAQRLPWLRWRRVRRAGDDHRLRVRRPGAGQHDRQPRGAPGTGQHRGPHRGRRVSARARAGDRHARSPGAAGASRGDRSDGPAGHDGSRGRRRSGGGDRSRGPARADARPAPHRVHQLGSQQRDPGGTRSATTAS